MIIDIVDHHTYVFLGDGCLMEGISHEACSLAGTLGLGKLICFWDDNGISIDGHVEGWFTDDTPKRFEAYGWHVVTGCRRPRCRMRCIRLYRKRARSTIKPSLICCKTVIGYGAPNLCGSHDCHGAALGVDEVAATRENIGWPHEPFVIPQSISEGWNAAEKGVAAEVHWEEKFAAYKQAHPQLAAEFERRMKGEFPAELGRGVHRTLCIPLPQRLKKWQRARPHRRRSMVLDRCCRNCWAVPLI